MCPGREETGETLREERGERTRGNRAAIGRRGRQSQKEGQYEGFCLC